MKDAMKILKMQDVWGLSLLICFMPVFTWAGEFLKPHVSSVAFLPMSVLLFPLLGTAIYFIVRNKEDSIKDSIAVIVTIIALVHSLFMIKYTFNPFEINGNEYQGLSFLYSYIPNFDLSLRVDKISMVILIIAGTFWFAVSCFVMYQNYKGETKYKGYNLNVLLALFLNFGILMAGDFLTLFLFVEGMAIFPYFVLIRRTSEIVAHEEKRFLLVEVVTSICLLLGIVLFYFFTNSLEMKDLVLFFATQVPPLWSGIIFALIVIGFIGKASLFFQHVFPSKTKTNVLLPVPGSFIFSLVMFQISGYGILRYMTVAFYKF